MIERRIESPMPSPALQMGRREAIEQRKTEIASAKKRRRGGKYVVEEADVDGVPRLSTKYVRNIIVGSFRAILRDALEIDRIPVPLRLSELCVGLKGGWAHEDEHEPDPDPFTPAERDAILEWFRTKIPPAGREGDPPPAWRVADRFRRAHQCAGGNAAQLGAGAPGP